MTVEEAIHSTVIDCMSDSLLEGVPNVLDRRNLARLSLHEERREELLFLCQRQILTPASSLACRLHGSDAQAVIGGDHSMHRCFADPTMLGNLFRLAWLYQCIVDDQPSLSTPGARIAFQSTLHFLNRKGRCCTGHSSHLFVLLPLRLAMFRRTSKMHHEKMNVTQQFVLFSLTKAAPMRLRAAFVREKSVSRDQSLIDVLR